MEIGSAWFLRTKVMLIISAYFVDCLYSTASCSALCEGPV